MKKITIILAVVFIAASLVIAIFTIFFDEAVLVRKGTIYRVSSARKVVALTFDDGPSSQWTPMVLDELKKAGVKATFFMLGEHAKMYPEIARRVAAEGHEIENHTYDHHVLIYYKKEELLQEIRQAEKIIKEIAGVETKYFRPPKAWLTKKEKKIINQMGYQIVLWTLNSKDWVTFDDKFMVEYLVHNVRPGDIILFHDSGGVLSTQGGDRSETVKTIPRLIEKLKEKGYIFLTIGELLSIKNHAQQK